MIPKPYCSVGAGPLTSFIWKSGDAIAGWKYRFNIFALLVMGVIYLSFWPRDLFQLVRLTQVLAAVIADDGCLSEVDRGVLKRLAAELDDLLTIQTSESRTRMENVMATQPIHEIRRGLLKVRIWRKRTRDGVRHTVAVTRLFRNGDVWKESTRFGRGDIPLMRLILDEAHTWIYQQTSTRGPRESDDYEFRTLFLTTLKTREGP